MTRPREIFLSSVQKEFLAERRALKTFIEADALLKRFFRVFLFEDLPASGRRAEEAYLAEVDRSRIYLALIGNEYGFEDAEGVSPTEREFDRATARGIERLIFVQGNDDGARHPKMRAFLRKAGDQLIRRRFTGLTDLTAHVYASLVDHLAASGAVSARPFDAAACPGATLDDLSGETLEEFLASAQKSREYALGPGTPMRNALVHLNLLDRDAPSHAAVLLFGRQPQRFLISSEIKCMHFHGTEVRKPIPSYQIYKGTVFELVDQAVDFVLSKIARAVGTRAESARAPVEYELPREAVTEAIVNAVAHRDYASSASVQVMLFSDRLEVWNPGQLPPPLTPAALRVAHASIPRNPLLAEPLFLTRYIEKAGTGTLDMIARCREAGLPPPAFRQDGGQFVQTLPRPAGAPDAATPPVAPPVTPPVAPPAGDPLEVVVMLLGGGDLGSAEIRSRLGLKDRTHLRERYLDPALEAGLIEPTLPDRPNSPNQKYRVTPKGRDWLAARTPGGTE